MWRSSLNLSDFMQTYNPRKPAQPCILKQDLYLSASDGVRMLHKAPAKEYAMVDQGGR